MPHMQEKILNAIMRDLSHLQVYEDTEDPQQEEINIKRKKASVAMLKNLRDLFGQLLWTNQNYADPTPVLENVVDDFGTSVPLGEQ
jgi:hypothetical protein